MPKYPRRKRAKIKNVQNINIRRKQTTGEEKSREHDISLSSSQQNENGTNVHLVVDPSPLHPMEICKNETSADNGFSSVPLGQGTEISNSDKLNEIRARVDYLTQKLEELKQTGTDATETHEDIDFEDTEMFQTYEKETEVKEKNVGRRIVAVTHFFSKLQEISNHGPLGCSITELKLIGETQVGLQSKFTFKCSLCNLKFVIDCDNCDEDYLPINKCAVAGTIAIGCGHSQLEELLSSINLPTVSEKVYGESHDLISKKWEEVLIESMKQAAEKEREFAIQENRVNKDGIPIIDVIVDGCWCKRSYKKNYNALSGAAAIIGKRTGEILFLGVKNKYCCICARAEKQQVEPSEHRCFKNFNGPSTNMESEILVEGFKQSINMHNLIYGRLISDGDSSTYSKILQARPYPDVTVEKVECRNHVLRNFCNKIQALSTETKYKIQFRKLITKKRILSTRATICKAIKKHKTGSDVHLLFEDILLSHLHGFGDHTKCRPYFCSKIGTCEDLPKDFFFSALWQRICLNIQSVASHARSLIHDVDSNAVERFHSIVAKYVGGKRINFAKKNSYQTRCHAAAVAFNEKKSISRLYKSLNKGASPRGKLRLLETKRINKNERSMKNRKPKNRSLFPKEKSKQDNNYGEDCLKPDMPIEVFETLKERFLENLKKTDEERQTIERDTILQGQSSEWLELRRTLLTASNFGKTIKRRNDTSCQNFVRDLLYKSNIDHVSSIKHGKDNEQLAIKQLENQEGIKIEPCGLFIDEHLQFLGATPDGLCGQDMIVEIKCPITANKLGIDEAINKNKVTFWKHKKNGLEINKTHQWYYQIQGQLHITKRLKCLFAVWSNERTPMKTELILRDDRFWVEQMEGKLRAFYLDCILPELVDPRHPRGMPIRNPSYIEEAIRKKIEKTKEKENIKPVKKVVKSTEDAEKKKVETREMEDYTDFLVDVSMPTCSRYVDLKNL